MRKSKESPEAPESQDEPVYVLTKNFGRVLNGRHLFWEKGTEFNQDDPVVADFHRFGAHIELKAQ